MDRKRSFREREKVHVMPARDGEELRFCVVEVGGKLRADIRYFAEGEKGIFPTSRGILVDPAKFGDFREGVEKLSERLAKK